MNRTLELSRPPNGIWDVARVEAELLPKIQFEKITPQGMNAEKFKVLTIDLVRRNPKLLEAIRQDQGVSFMTAISSCVELGLSMNEALGEAAVVPHKGRVVLRPMYRGLRKLALRSPQIVDIWADVIYEGEAYEIVKGDQPRLIHKPSFEPGVQDPKNLIFAYGVALFNDGHRHFEAMPKWDVDACRDASESWQAYVQGRAQSSVWESRTAEQWKKTAIRRLCKNLNLENEQLEKAELLDNEDYNWKGSRMVRTSKPLPSSQEVKEEAPAAPESYVEAGEDPILDAAPITPPEAAEKPAEEKEPVSREELIRRMARMCMDMSANAIEAGDILAAHSEWTDDEGNIRSFRSLKNLGDVSMEWIRATYGKLKKSYKSFRDLGEAPKGSMIWKDDHSDT